METTKNKMPPYAKQFFYNLSNYLDTQIYYYGSIQRNDYFPQYPELVEKIKLKIRNLDLTDVSKRGEIKKYSDMLKDKELMKDPILAQQTRERLQELKDEVARV